MTTSVELLNNAIRNININEYCHDQKYDFRNANTLYSELMRDDITVENIMKWQLQIMECIKHDYIRYIECPQVIDPMSILLDNNKDVVYHTVVFDRQINTIAYEAKYTDCLIRIHSTLFQYIYEHIDTLKHKREIYLLGILGKYFYAGIGCTSYKGNVLRTCDIIEQLNEIIELGVIDELLNGVGN